MEETLEFEAETVFIVIAEVAALCRMMLRTANIVRGPGSGNWTPTGGNWQ